MHRYHPDHMHSPKTGSEEIARALDELNVIKFTVNQFERGREVYRMTPHKPGLFETFKTSLEVHDCGMEALVAWCEAEGLLPADLTAHAIFYRGGRISSFHEGGIRNPKETHPEAYEHAILSPLNGWDFISTNADPRYPAVKLAGLLPD